MDREKAKNIIKNKGLIPGKMGRKILLSIINNQELGPDELSSSIDRLKIESLKNEYHEKLEKLGTIKYPRNYVFYQLIQERYPDFHFRELGNNQWQFDFIRVKNLRPSLASILFGLVCKDSSDFLADKYERTDVIPLSTRLDLLKLMEDLQVIYPTQDKMNLIIDWLIRGLSGERLTLFAPACPDYSVEETGDPNCPFRHDFKSLNSGLGQIAQRVLSALPFLVNFLNRNNIRYRIIVAFGDFEAYSESNLRIFHTSESEFVTRVNNSKEQFSKLCPRNVDVYLMTELSGGKLQWLENFKYIKNLLNKNNFGNSSITTKKLLEIAKARKNLYERWYGKMNTARDYIPYVINQGIEYGTMGLVISNLEKNVLVLGADNDVMAPFYSVVNIIPTLYLKRFYC